jgi:hypothetical protein
VSRGRVTGPRITASPRQIAGRWLGAIGAILLEAGDLTGQGSDLGLKHLNLCFLESKLVAQNKDEVNELTMRKSEEFLAICD